MVFFVVPHCWDYVNIDSFELLFSGEMYSLGYLKLWEKTVIGEECAQIK